MAGNKGGGSTGPLPFQNNQNQTSTGSSTGTLTGQNQNSQTGNFLNNQTGNFLNNQTGNFLNNQIGNTAGSTRVVAPEGWQAAWMGMQPGASGFNPMQQGAANWMQGALDSGDPAGLGMARGYFSDTLANRTAPTLRNLAAIDPATYGAPAGVVSRDVGARQGSEFMSAYQNPFQRDVIDASLSQFDQDSAEARNSLRAGNAGAFGNKRFGVAEGQFAADSALGRASLGSNLRAQGFNTAAGFGMQDANRFLQADASNADRALQAGMFNNNMTNNRQQFDANLGMAYNDQRDRTAMNLGNLGLAGLGASQGLANSLFAAGGTGVNQGLNWLNAGTPLFGTDQTGSSSQSGSGSTAENSTGTVNQNTTGTVNQNTTGTVNQNTTGTTNMNSFGSSSGFNTQANQNGGKGGILGGLGSLAMGVAPFFNPATAAIAPLSAVGRLAQARRGMS